MKPVHKKFRHILNNLKINSWCADGVLYNCKRSWQAPALTRSFSRGMFVLSIMLALQGVIICGHMVKSNVHHGIETAEELIAKNAKIVTDDSVSQANQDFLKSIAFHPPNIDFGAWSIGTARSYLVTLINKNANKSVHLSSISGNTQEFYSSFFEDKIVPPQGNTTFNVVFLPRHYGAVETDLFIHTSFGQARLPVRGEGKECPYRIRSLVGIKAPFNATISPEIYMYNPHPRPIQILEIYSSGGQFQLELPSGGQEGPQALWEIPSHTTKPIIRIRFHAIQPGNHTAFIRIKIAEMPDLDESTEESVLVIPVEIEISEDTGLYSPNPVLDFGKLTTLDGERTLEVSLMNSGKHSFQGLEYRLENVDGLVELDKSGLTLRLNPKLATRDVSVNGLLLVQMWRYSQSNIEKENKGSQKFVELSVGVRAEVYKGSLEFLQNQTVFITGVKDYKSGERAFIVENKFNTPIEVANISLEDNDTSVFRIEEFEPRVIVPSETADIFRISVVNESANFKTILKIHTNLSIYELPVIVCSGLLHRYTSMDPLHLSPLPEENVLNFGAVQYQDFSHNGYILLRNPNPMPISILEWSLKRLDRVFCRATFIGCGKIADFDSSRSENLSSVPITQQFSYCTEIGPQEVAAIQLAVQSYVVKPFTSVFDVATEYETIETAVNFIVVMGRLEVDPSRLHFADCFPGKRCSADISIHSTFVKNMQVNSITVSVPGLIFEYHTQEGLPEIVANSVTDVGRIHFDPKTVCGKRCYILPGGTEDVEIAVPLELDEAELRRRTDLFRRFKYNLQMITFTLNTSEVRLYEFNSTVDIVWPKLVRGHQIIPTIEIGQNYRGEIFITNPSIRNLRVELVLADPRKAKSTSLSLPLEVIDNCVYCYLTDEDVFVIGDANKERITVDIKAGSTVSVAIQFLGKVAGQFSTLLHVYNNLTLYEAVWITGKAVQPQFRFGNRKSGSTTPLLFEISEKHLVNCDRSSIESTEPFQISTKRTFTARNTGEVPIMVEKFIINDSECEGYGFRILDCDSFELKANSSRKVEIAFSPDFTMTRVSHTLLIKINLSSDVNYTLLATVPASYLDVCSKSLQRPFWEGHVKRMSVGALLVAFIFVLVAACIDSDKVLKDHVQNISKDKGPMQPPLDLRNIGMKQSVIEEPVTNGDSAVNIIEKNANKFGYANLKRRNVKRSSFSSLTSSQDIAAKEKSWAEELAKKIRNVSSTSSSCSSSASTLSPKPTILSKAIQTMSSAASVATVLRKPVKYDKAPAARKSTCKESVESCKTTTPEKNEQLEIDKKASMKPDESIIAPESKKQRTIVKKSKSVPIESTYKDNDQSIVTFSGKVPEKPTRPSKSILKEKSDSQNIGDKKLAETLADIPNTNRPKQDSPTNAERISPRGNVQVKKFGKTPGRERKKETNGQSSSKRKPPKFKGTAFQFTAPLDGSSSNSSPSTPSTSTTIVTNAWETNPAATFSNIVAQKALPKSEEQEQIYDECGLKPMLDELDQDSNNNTNHDWNEADLKNHETFGIDGDEKVNSSDLGPIGTKKSPSSTPVWEPFIASNLHRPTANLSPQNSSNTSFFSSNFPIGANFDYTNQYLGGTSGLLEHVFEESQQFTHIPPNDLLLSWLQQEQIRQQTMGWTAGTNRTWTPMGYQDDPIPAALPPHEQMNVWQPTATASGVVRPPPGIPLRSNHGSPVQQHQQHTQMQAPSPPSAQLTHSAHSQGNVNLSGNTIDGLQPYQPYVPFNSIWSEAWNKQDKK